MDLLFVVKGSCVHSLQITLGVLLNEVCSSVVVFNVC